MTKAPSFLLTLPAALLLSGCLSGGKPAQMYRFGVVPGDAPAGPTAAATRTIQLSPVVFAAAIDGDRLMTTRGTSAAYIKGVRWAATAPALFTAALLDAARQRAPNIALVGRRDGAASAPVLRISITRFEAVFGSGAKGAAPEIWIEGAAVLTDPRGTQPGLGYRIKATRTAASDRIGDIVAAFDAADAEVVVGLGEWLTASADPRRSAALRDAPPSARPSG